MVISDTKIICKSCNQQTKFQDLLSIEDKLVCNACYDKIKQGKPVIEKIDEPKQKIEKEFKEFICNACTYKFNFNINSKMKLICPYCGKNNVKENKNAGDGLIKDSEGYDW